MKCEVSLLSSTVQNAFKVKLTKTLITYFHVYSSILRKSLSQKTNYKAVKGIYTFSLWTLRSHSFRSCYVSVSVLSARPLLIPVSSHLRYISPLITNKALHIFFKKIKAYNLILGCQLCTDHIVLASHTRLSANIRIESDLQACTSSLTLF